MAKQDDMKLYKKIKHKCAPDFLSDVIKRTLLYKYLDIKLLDDTDTRMNIIVENEKQNAITVVKTHLKELLSTFELTVHDLRNLLQLADKNKTQYIGIVNGIIELMTSKLGKFSGTITQTTMTIHFTNSDKNVLNDLLKIIGILRIRSTNQVLKNAKDWIKQVAVGTEYNAESLDNILIMLEHILEAMFEQHNITLLNSSTNYHELFTIHLRHYHKLTSLQINAPELKTYIINQIKTDMSSGAHYIYDKSSYLGLLLEDREIIIEDPNTYKRATKTIHDVYGIASMCFSGKNKIRNTAGGKVVFSHGITSTDINNLDRIKLYISESEAHPINQYYHELSAHFIVDFLRCNPQKIRDYLVPYTNLSEEFSEEYTGDIEHANIILELQKAQRDIWVAENSLLQHQPQFAENLQAIINKITQYHIFNALFTRVRNLYNPALEFTRRFGIAITYTDLRNDKVDQSYDLPPIDIFNTRDYDQSFIDSDYDGSDDDGDFERPNRWNEFTQNIELNETHFNKNIAPLLGDDLSTELRNERHKMIDDNGDTFYDMTTLNLLLHKLNMHTMIQQKRMREITYYYLIDCIVRNTNFKEPFRTGVYQPEKAETMLRVIKATEFKPDELINDIRELSCHDFIANLPKLFKHALYCYLFSTSDVSIIRELYKYKDCTLSKNRKLDANIAELARAESVMQVLLDTLSDKLLAATPRPSDGGGIIKSKTKRYLMVTNTNTMRTIRKPIFKVNNQSKVRHNNALVLVSKYKLILGKRHNRQISFQIVRE